MPSKLFCEIKKESADLSNLIFTAHYIYQTNKLGNKLSIVIQYQSFKLKRDKSSKLLSWINEISPIIAAICYDDAIRRVRNIVNCTIKRNRGRICINNSSSFTTRTIDIIFVSITTNL